MINKDEVKGKATEVKGVVKEQAGKLMNDPDLETEGQVDQAVGDAQAKVGTAKRKIENAIKGD